MLYEVITRIEHFDDAQAVPAVTARLLPLCDAVQKMLALQAQRLARLDVRHPNITEAQADVRSHLFAIDSLATPKSTLLAGDVVTQGALTLDIVCYQCHREPGTGIGGSEAVLSLSIV